jgi:hypothetical protein
LLLIDEVVAQAGYGFDFCILHTSSALHCFSGTRYGGRSGYISALFRDLYKNASLCCNIISLVGCREDELIVDETLTLITEIETCNGGYLSVD